MHQLVLCVFVEGRWENLTFALSFPKKFLEIFYKVIFEYQDKDSTFTCIIEYVGTAFCRSWMNCVCHEVLYGSWKAVMDLQINIHTLIRTWHYSGGIKIEIVM